MLRRVGKVAVVGVAYHVPGTGHPDLATLDVLSSLLTAKPTGRLYKALVETHKATSVSAGVSSTRDPYLLEVSASVAPKVAPEEVRDIICDVLENLAAGKMSRSRGGPRQAQTGGRPRTLVDPKRIHCP